MALRPHWLLLASISLSAALIQSCHTGPEHHYAGPEVDGEEAEEEFEEEEADSPREFPRPTENWMSEREEERNHFGRARWIERMHKAAPGVDWKAVDRANIELERERRNNLAHLPFQTFTFWREVGSRNQAGRTPCMARGPQSGSAAKLYCGADNGGLWRGEPNGTNWLPLGDNLGGGVQWIVALPAENAGEPDVLVAAQDGGAFHVSRDNGGTWETPIGLPALSSVRGLALLNDAQHTVLVYGQYNSGGTKPGVFASTNYGRNFTNRWTGAANWPGWMWVPRRGAGASNTAYLLQQGRIYTSTNSGVTFTAGATIEATATKGVLAGSEAGAPTLYAALYVGTQWKLYRSDNAGGAWAFVYDINDFWEGSMCASSIDPSIVAFGGLEVYRSTNAGASFTKVNTWGSYYGDPAHKLHADISGIYAWPDPAGEPLGSETWYVGTDGGLFKSDDGLATVLNLSLTGLGVSQYYATLTSRTAPNLILAGAQDQGYQRGTYAAPALGGPSTDFAQLISGDYGHLTSSDGSHNVVYSTYPGFVLVQQGQTSPALSQVNFPTGSAHDWLPMVVADPQDANGFFFCGEKLYRYQKSGTTWVPSVHSTFNFLTTGASFLTAIGTSRTTTTRMYAANDAGKLFYSGDHGVNWTQSASSGPSPHYFYGNSIAVHPTNALEAVIGGSGYSTAGVRRTTDGGVTWNAIATGLPQTQVYDLAWAEDGSGDVYAATSIGAYRWIRTLNSWANVMESGTPITTYWSVEAVENGAKMRFGSYGRGIWDYTIPPSGPLATWMNYGTNLGGANTLTLDTLSLPHIGTTMSFSVTSPVAAATTGWIYASTFGGSLPLFGGTFLCDPVSQLQRVRLDATGHGSARWPIANDPFLIGQTLSFQAVVLDATQPQGFALSNGLIATFGP